MRVYVLIPKQRICLQAAHSDQNVNILFRVYRMLYWLIGYRPRAYGVNIDGRNVTLERRPWLPVD